MGESRSVRPDLFKGLKFCLIDDGEIVDKIKAVLLEGGGSHNSYLSDMVTHVICDNPDNPGVSEALELFEKPVVTSRWVLLSARCNKLLPLNGFSPVRTQLFYGLVFCPSQMSIEDKKKLWAMATFYGGTFNLNFTKSCTHLVMGKPEGAKYEKSLQNSDLVKIVTPDWVSDSVRNGSLCDEDLYHPRLLILEEPEASEMLSPNSPSFASALMSLDKMNMDSNIQPSVQTSTSGQIFLQNFPRQIKLPNFENRIADDILGNLPDVSSIKTEPVVQQSPPEQTFVSNRIPGLPTSSPQLMNLIARPHTSPSPQSTYQQTLHHQQMLQQGEQKLNQALQKIQAQQQPLLQQRTQLQTAQPQLLQQKVQWQQQRMTFASQQQIQHLAHMQRVRLLQQQQQLRNRQALPPQLAQLQQQQQQQQQQNIQSQVQQQPNSQSHLLQQQQNILQKQAQMHAQQMPHQQSMTQQGQQAQHIMSPSDNQNIQPQMHIQLQAQMRQQQALSQLQQQQALTQLQKHQLQQQLQQQLLKQQHLQHLQQQQQQQQQVQLNQQRAVTQSPSMPPSPLHLQQQGILQPSPRQSPLQQSPLQHSPLQQSLQQSPRQHSPRQHSPQQSQAQTQQSGVQLQHQQSPLPGQRPQTPLQQQSPQQTHHQIPVPLSPLTQAQQLALEKAQQTAAEKLQQTELIKVQLQQSALERAQFQQAALEKVRLQQSLEKAQLHQVALEKAQLQAGFENSHLQQNLLQHSQLQRSAGQPLHLSQATAQQLQQQIHQLQLQKNAIQQSSQSLQLQQTPQKIEMQSGIQQGQLQHSTQFSVSQAQLQSVAKSVQLQASAQQMQQNSVQRLQLQQLSVQQLQQQQRLQLQQGSAVQRLHLQGAQAQQLQLQQGSTLQQLQQGSIQHLQLQQGTLVQQLSQGSSSQHLQLQQGNSQQLQQGSPAQQLQQVSQQLRLQQGSPAQQVQLQQGSPAQLPQGSPAQLQQGSPAQQIQLQGSPSSQQMQLQQGSPSQHLQLSQGSPAQHGQLQQASNKPIQQVSSQQVQLQQVPSQQTQIQVPSHQIQQASSQHLQLQSQTQVSSQQNQMQHPQSQVQKQIVSQQNQQQNLSQVTLQTASQAQDVSSQSQPVSLQQAQMQLSSQPPQVTQISSPLSQIPQMSNQNQFQQMSTQQVQMTQVSPQQSELQQNRPQMQISAQQQTQILQNLSSRDINRSSAPSPLRQTSPIQMQLHSPAIQAQLQKAQLQRAQQVAAQQSQLQHSPSQQVLLKQVSQSQLQQSLSPLQSSTQSANQSIQLQQTSVQQVQLQHVIQQARLQQLRQQQAQLQQSITANSSQQSQVINAQQHSNLQQNPIMQSSPQAQLQQNSGQPARQSLSSPQSNIQAQIVPGSPQPPRLQSPLQQAQLQQLALQQAQLQKSSISQTVVQQNQLQAQLQQAQLRQAALQQARLQQPSATAQQILQGHLPRPQQQSHIQTQIVTKQIQLQQQPSSQILQQQQTPPASPQLQQQPRFTHQLSPSMRPVQKQFSANLPTTNQPPMHGQPPVQGLHQQQLLQQRQQLQQQLALQQLRQRQLQQQQLQNSQQSPQQAVQILAGQPPVMMKPPPQYPYDRQQLQGQPRLQYPTHIRQLSPQQQASQHPRAPWQQVPGQQTQFLRRSPGANPPPSPQWQHVQQPSPKEELTPSPQPAPTQPQAAWPQRQQLSTADTRETTTPVPQTASQQVLWQQNQQQQQSTPQREPNQTLQQSQLIQWQQLKQLELRRQQLLQQQQQQQATGQRLPSQPQFSSSDQLNQPGQRLAAPPQQQTLAVPAQYQPPNAPSILSQTSPGSVVHSAQPAAQVTPKTKTALANLLNTRLQTTGRTMDGDCNQALIRTTQVISQPTQTVSRRSSAESISVVQAQNQISSERPVIPPVPQIIFHGHDAKLNVPPDLCLLGCVFCIEDYDKSVDNDKLDMWKKIILQHGGEIEATYNSKCTHVICESQRNSIVQQAMREGKRCVTAYWLNDVLAKKKLKYPWFAHHLPTPFSDEKPCKNQIISITNFEPDERTVLKHVIQILGAKYTGYMTSHNTVIICKRKEGKKVQRAKDWRIPVVNVQWLHDLIFGHFDALRLPMAHKYQQYDLDNPFAIDYALVPHLMAAWKVPVKISEELLKESKKRENEDKCELEAKRIRVESPPLEENIPLTTQNPPDNENKPRVLFTGLGSVKDFAKIVCQLGGCLAKSSTECSHLVANQYARTVKFLCAIHVVKYVVTVEWLTECGKQNKFVDEEPYILHDPENEKTFGFSLEKTLKRIDRSPIFKDYVFFITSGVFPKPEILKHIIEAGGGVPVFKKAPTLRQVKTMEQSGRNFVIITCDNDLHLCKMYLDKNISVQNVEFVLTGSIRQELDFSSFSYNK